MITILTEPSVKRSFRLYKLTKGLVKHYILKRDTPKYSGHLGVVRSLIEGFDKIGAAYNYNPKRVSGLAQHVHVVGGVQNLKLAISLKRRGKIKRLTAGPNVVISSADHDGIVASKEIDLFVVNSEWTKNAYLVDNPKMQNRISYFPSGVDANFWNINKTRGRQLRLAFYKKRPEPLLYEACLKMARQNGAQVTEIIYGHYNLDGLKNTLATTDFVVYFVEQESQGIALAEIWATNTPTLVWNPEFWHHRMKNYRCSSAPYLTPQTGLFFRTAEGFDALFKNQQLDVKNFQPRRWVLENMTDEVCTERFLKIVKANEANRQGHL